MTSETQILNRLKEVYKNYFLDFVMFNYTINEFLVTAVDDYGKVAFIHHGSANPVRFTDRLDVQTFSVIVSVLSSRPIFSATINPSMFPF